MRTALAIALAFLALACKKPAPTAPPEPGAVTVEEATPLAEALLESLRACEPGSFGDQIDIDFLARRIAAQLALRSLERHALVSGLKEDNDLASYVCEAGDSVRLTSVEAMGTTALARYRANSDGGVNFLELHIGRTTGNAIRVYDVFDYISGELLSTKLVRVFESIQGRLRSKSFTNKLERDIDELNRLEANGDYAGARAVLARLPPKMRALRTLMVRDLHLASKLEDDEAYLAALTALEKAFPDDPSLAPVLYDAYFMRGEYDQALASVDRLAARVGQDAYLDVMRAAVEIERKRYPAAVRHARAAIAREATMEDAYWNLASAQLGAEAWDEAATTLGLLRDRFEVELTRAGMELAAEDVPGYRGFLASPAAARFFGEGSD